MRLTWLGHSCFLLETESHRVLFDPFLDDNPRAPITADRIDCDVILCSHAHEDHLGDALKIARRTSAVVVANYELAGHLAAEGISTVDLMPGGMWGQADLTVSMTPAVHSSALELPGGKNLPLGEPAGFVVRVGGKSIYHAGDTALFSDMKLVARADLDLALLPIGGHYTMGVEDAVHALDFLLPRLAMPMHYDTYDAIKADPQAFARLAAAAGHRVRVPPLGTAIDL
jgi:L-ascorbate metabolism protein UlaG (beta-lactamase superfamily)